MCELGKGQDDRPHAPAYRLLRRLEESHKNRLSRVLTEEAARPQKMMWLGVGRKKLMGTKKLPGQGNNKGGAAEEGAEVCMRAVAFGVVGYVKDEHSKTEEVVVVHGGCSSQDARKMKIKWACARQKACPTLVGLHQSKLTFCLSLSVPSPSGQPSG